jgi:hypothetical protein
MAWNQEDSDAFYNYLSGRDGIRERINRRRLGLPGVAPQPPPPPQPPQPPINQVPPLDVENMYRDLIAGINEVRQIRNLRGLRIAQQPGNNPVANPVLISYNEVMPTPLPVPIDDSTRILGKESNDPILGDTPVREILLESNQSSDMEKPIFFVLNNSIVNFTRQTLNYLLRTNQSSIIQYICFNTTAAFFVTPNMVETNTPYFTNSHIMLYGYTPLSFIKYIIENPSITVVKLVPTGNQLIATASYGAISTDGLERNIVSKNHCQAGSGAEVYDMLDISATALLGENQEEEKEEELIGGRQRKRNKKYRIATVKRPRKTNKNKRRKSKRHLGRH